MKNKEAKKANIFKAFYLMAPKFARVSPALFSAFCVVCFAHAVARALLIPATQVFLDRALDFASHKTELSGVASGLALLTSAHVFRQLMHGVHHVLMLMYWRKAEGALALDMHKKLGRLSPVVFEDTLALDSINKAVQGKDEAVWFTGSTFTIFSFYLPYFACLSIYLIRVKPVLVLLLALVFAPTLLSHIIRSKNFAKAEDNVAPIRREFEYYEQCITGREYFKETRVLGAFSFFKNLYAMSLSRMNIISYRASVKSGVAELIMKFISLGGYIGTLLLLLDLLLSGEISAGAFAAIFSSMYMVFSLMEELIFDNLGVSAQNLGRVQNYLSFLRMPERIGAEAEPSDDVEPFDAAEPPDEAEPSDDVEPSDAEADIILRDVSFTYPGAEQKAVDGVSFTIKAGETVALVGENGSGKTTLVRLITGLYLPDEGDVSYGALNTKSTPAASLFKNITAVFQKYQHYQMTLRDNISISDVSTIARDSTLEAAAAGAGFDAGGDVYTGGYDTMLSREFDGIELSGGQWQRVAIARGFFRAHRLIVLDEPTAAIDPIEETHIYKRFSQISKGKTAIVVTHRLGSARLADRIFVMKSGRLVERGAHDELTAAGGEYARLYKSQEQWYL